MQVRGRGVRRGRGSGHAMWEEECRCEGCRSTLQLQHTVSAQGRGGVGSADVKGVRAHTTATVHRASAGQGSGVCRCEGCRSPHNCCAQGHTGGLSNRWAIQDGDGTLMVVDLKGAETHTQHRF
jgi:hypothetical protein